MISSAKKSKKAPAKLDIRFTHIVPVTGEKTAQGKGKRKKVNFMVNQELFESLKSLIPERERSDFVNYALEEAMKDASRRKASQMIDEWREKVRLHMTNKEIRKLREYGRR